MKSKQLRKAFSLVEASIIILIIGVVIAGISKSSLIYSKYLTVIAKNKTSNSPVSSTEGLIMWFETTLNESMPESSRQDYSELSEAEKSSNSSIGVVDKWNDISSTDGTRQSLYGTSKSSAPKYKSDCINGLPCVEFDGNDDLLNFSQLPLSGTEFTIFIVEKPNLSNIIAPLMGPSAFTSGYNTALGLAIENNKSLIHLHNSLGYFNRYEFSSLGITDPMIHTISSFFNNKIIDPNNSQEYGVLYEKNNKSDIISPLGSTLSNGVWIVEKLNIDSATIHTLGSAYINDGNSGAVKFYSGGIGEIIIYKKTLKSKDRKAIQNYLMEKWQIK